MAREYEINPENEVVRQMSDNWHKIVAIILNKLNLRELEITPEDIAKLEQDFPGGPAVLADARADRFVVRLISDSEARRLARSH